MHKNTSKKGFTLVEIMIVVVIIGLLAAMAIPAFQKVRESSRSSAMDNDARQLAAAAQQYMLENSLSTVTASITTLTGAVGTPLDAYVSQVGKGYTSTSVTITANGTFSLAHPQVATGSSTYSAEGQKQ
ncbi:MAG: prepilin-type N-terminal cleavage/methylation domain-containing protein [Opitutales bacterium]